MRGIRFRSCERGAISVALVLGSSAESLVVADAWPFFMAKGFSHVGTVTNSLIRARVRMQGTVPADVLSEYGHDWAGDQEF